MIQGRNIICLASSWGIDPTSKHQVMRRLAAKNRVLWVNYHGSRRPRPGMRDLLHSMSTLREVARGTSQVASGVTTITPLLLPVPGSATIRGVNSKLIISQIRRAVRDWPDRPYQVWSFAPDVGELLGHFHEEAVIYYCVDEFGEFTGYDAELIQRLERDVIGKSDLVLTSSQRLHESRSRLHPHVYKVTHGVDEGLFLQAMDEATKVPEQLRNLPGPVIGFFGLIDDWFDADMVAGAARMRPDWSFVLVGAVHQEVSRLMQLPNVHFPGRVSYDLLAGYCKGFDVATIPFVVNDLTLHANPIKLREYLCAGLPVVATRLPEVLGYQPHVRIVDSSRSFVGACEACLAEDSPSCRKERSAIVSGESWDTRVEQISDHVQSVIGEGNLSRACLSRMRLA